MSGFAFDLDPAVMLLDDAVDRGEAEAGALADRFRREERLENVRLHQGINPAASVLDTDTYETAGVAFGMFQCGLRLDFLARNANGQLTARWHGVARIDGE